MDLAKKLEKLVSTQDDTLLDVQLQILQELKEIKNLLKLANRTKRKSKQEYYNFVNKLRAKLKPDTTNNIFPEIIYNSQIIGITSNGYLYNKETNEELKAQQAFKVYQFLYKNQDELDRYLRNINNWS